jgi:hypothetical protein
MNLSTDRVLPARHVDLIASFPIDSIVFDGQDMNLATCSPFKLAPKVVSSNGKKIPMLFHDKTEGI